MNKKTLDAYKEQIAFIESHFDEMKKNLFDWSEINSGSLHLAGLRKMKTRLEKDLSVLGGVQETFESKPIEEVTDKGDVIQLELGDCLSITKRPEAPFQVLLGGHMDTVFDENHSFQKVKELEVNRWNGPGLTDMKGGLMVMSYALQAFEQSPWAEKLGWQVIINADEEIGSLGSEYVYKQASQGKNLALLYEPSMNEQGSIASDRRGNGKISLVVKGMAAHAGRSFEAGRSAICALSELITEIHALNGQKQGVTINVGYISGGGALNVVPDNAVAKCDIRITEPSDESWFMGHLNTLVKKYNQRDGISVTTHGVFGRPPKKVTPDIMALLKRIQVIGKVLDITIDWIPSGGCCDGNNIASYGVPVVDTLGVRGAHIHRETEYVILDSLVERAKLSAILLMELAQAQE